MDPNGPKSLEGIGRSVDSLFIHSAADTEVSEDDTSPGDIGS
jgi:hypothetical protein